MNPKNIYHKRPSGFQDRNGTDICEGDIITANDGKNKFIIEFQSGAFIRRTLKLLGCEDLDRLSDPVHTLYYSEQIEKTLVVGNIYDNPELI